MQLFEATPPGGTATVPFGTQQQVPAAPAETTKPTVKVVVVGDSFTSGEGADSSTYRRVPVPYTTEDNLTYETVQIDPAHQSSTAPTLQALGRIQAANPGTPFEQAPQINAVRGADVVIVGIDARFAD
ncbi:MAG TPA: hypothetical protein VGP26_31515 [Actinophytocola sp.]|nr:hypothetical protein [Actinophytocola sp.]